MRISDWSSDVCSSDLLRAVMPEGIATHSRAQEFYFGADGLLRRQDYTLDIADGSRIANYALDIVDVDGIRIASKRRAYQIGRAHVELQSLMRISYAVFGLKKKKIKNPCMTQQQTN